MAKPKLIAVALVALVLLGAAGFLVYTLFIKEDGQDNDDNKTSEAIENAPIGCPKSTSVVVKSEEAGTQKISTANSNFIHWRDDQGLLIFTNYTLNPDSVYSDITGDRVLTVVKLSHQDATKLAIGTYRKTAAVAGEASPNQYSSEYNISTEGLAGGVFDNNATVEVTYLGTDYICGTVTSDDGSSSIKGEFIAKYIDKL
jgi:hypothetical protein